MCYDFKRQKRACNNLKPNNCSHFTIFDTANFSAEDQHTVAIRYSRFRQ